MINFLKHLHKILGILLGIPLFISGITGAIYVWQPELTTLSYPELNLKQEVVVELSPEVLVGKVLSNTNKDIHRLYFPERERKSYCIKFVDDEHYYFYHPTTAEYLGNLKHRRGWLDVVLKLHTLSYLKNGPLIIAWSSLLLALFLLSSGLWLWIPRDRKLKAIDFSMKKSHWKTPSFFFKGHRVFGFYFSVVLLFIALTGSYFIFKKEYKILISSINGQEASAPASFENANEGKLINIYEALKLSDSLFTHYEMRNIILSTDKNTKASISWMRERGISSGKRDRPYVHINPQTKELVYVYDPHKANKTDMLVNGLIPQIHFGELGGVFTRILNFMASLALALLVISGYYMTWRKTKKGQF